MYRMMVIISWFIRQFWISNPFEALGEGLVVRIGEKSLLLNPELLNWGIGFILPGVTYFVVGFYYEKGSAPALGSILYLLVYCVHIFLLRIVSLFRFSTWVVVAIVLLYIGCHVVLTRIRNCGLCYKVK